MHTTALPLSAYDPEGPYKVSMKQLEDLKGNLTKLAGDDIVIRIRSEDLLLEQSLDSICQEENGDMVVMGLAGKSKIEKTLIGSNAVNVSQNSHFPILIVPAKANIQPVRSILFACDLKGISPTTSVGRLSTIFEFFNVQLFVLNVDHEEKHFSPETPAQIQKLHKIFDKFKPQYSFIDHEDTTGGIMEYAHKNDISVIVTIPKNYNFFQKLLHKSKTEKLMYESDIPLLTLHE